MQDVHGLPGSSSGATTSGALNLVMVYDKVRAQLLFSQRRTLRERLASRRMVFVAMVFIFAAQGMNIFSVSQLSSRRARNAARQEEEANKAPAHSTTTNAKNALDKDSTVSTIGKKAPAKHSPAHTVGKKAKASHTHARVAAPAAKARVETDADDDASSQIADEPSMSEYDEASNAARRKISESVDRLVFGFFLTYMLCIFALVLKVKGPSRIFVTDEGLRFKWYLLPATPCIPWSSVESVATRKIEYAGVLTKWRGRLYNSKSIELNLGKHSLSISQWSLLQLLLLALPDPIIPRFNPKQATIKLDARAIIHDSDRQQFISILEQKVGAEFMNPELMELKAEGGEEKTSFTKVWLETFEGSARGLDPLASDAVLAGGEYQIVNRLAAGGQAVTYSAVRQIQAAKSPRASATNLPRASATNLPACAEPAAVLKLPSEEKELVVLKEFVLPERGGSKIRNRALANIDHEASLLRQLNHPHIVKLVDTFVQGHRAYLVMEKIDGQSLRQLVQQHGVFAEQAVRILANQMCEILQYLHEQKPPIIHQDFTPDNLLLKPNGQLVLIDFNVAEQLEQECTKTVVGKHCYMPPEQFRGRPSPQSDIYAMGATLCFLLTGKDPEPISVSHPRSLNPNVSETLDAIIAHATNPDTAKRYLNAQSIEQDLSSATRELVTEAI